MKAMLAGGLAATVLAAGAGYTVLGGDDAAAGETPRVKAEIAQWRWAPSDELPQAEAEADAVEEPAAAADPEPAALLDRVRRAALARHAHAVDELAEKPGFTGRISLQRATEVVATLLSPETYGLLVVAQGWTALDWAEWVGTHIVVDLFPAERA